jgi:hypothetical protein
MEQAAHRSPMLLENQDGLHFCNEVGVSMERGRDVNKNFWNGVEFLEKFNGSYPAQEHIVLSAQGQYGQADFDSSLQSSEKAVAARLLHSSQKN